MKVYMVYEEEVRPTTFVSREDTEKYVVFYNLEEYFIEEIEVYSWAEYENLFIV